MMVWRDRSLLLGSCIYESNSFLTAFMIPSISITLDEHSDTFILARHKEVVRPARALSCVLRPRFLAVSVYIAICLALLDY